MNDLPANGTPTGQVDQAPDVASAALRYVEAGLHVLPLWGITNGHCDCEDNTCAHAGKHPLGRLVPTGVNGSSTDQETVSGWFAAYPNANVAIATGHDLLGGGNLVVLDVDPGRGGTGSLAKLEAQCGPLPRGALVLTGGGGGHFYLRVRNPIPQSRDRLGAGLEVKAAGGYVVAPPSMHASGQRYRYSDGIPALSFGIVPDAPEWFVALVAQGVSAATGFEAKVACEADPSLRDIIARRSHRLLSEKPTRHDAAVALGHESVDYPVDAVASVAADVFPRVANALNVNGDRLLTSEEVERAVRDGHAWALERGLRSADDPEPVRILTLEQLAELPPPSWLVEDVLPSKALTALVGPSGIGKSFVALSMSLSVAHASSWFGRTTEPGTVVYLAAEGASGFTRRVTAWNYGHMRKGNSRVRCIPEPVNLYNGTDVECLRVALASLSDRPTLLVVDTLARCIVGADENSAKDMGRVLDNCYRLIREFDFGVLLVHHTGWDARHERGSTALRGAVDALWALANDEGNVRMTCEKMKEADSSERFTLHLAPVLESCVLRLGGNPGRLGADQLSVLRCLSESFGSDGAYSSQLQKASRVPERSFHRALKELESRGFIARKRQGRNTRVSITDDGRTELEAHLPTPANACQDALAIAAMPHPPLGGGSNGGGITHTPQTDNEGVAPRCEAAEGSVEAET